METTVIVDFDVTVTGEQTGGVPGGLTGPPPAPAQPTYVPRTARISGGVMAGQNLTKVQPVYPEEARAKGVSGTVVLHVLIGKDGRVESLTAISGPEVLRQAALDAVSQWTYKPYRLNGDPVEVDTTVTVNFSLGGE